MGKPKFSVGDIVNFVPKVGFTNPEFFMAVMQIRNVYEDPAHGYRYDVEFIKTADKYPDYKSEVRVMENRLQLDPTSTFD